MVPYNETKNIEVIMKIIISSHNPQKQGGCTPRLTTTSTVNRVIP